MSTELSRLSSRWADRLAELGVRWRLQAVKSAADAEAVLHERIMELNGLYAVAQLEARAYERFDDFLDSVVDVLPPSFRYPEQASARLELDGREHFSLHYDPRGPKLQAPILQHGRPAGLVEVTYAPAPPADIPFLPGERRLLEAVAERIGVVAARHEAETSLVENHRQLVRERQALREANAALREVLSRLEEEKAHLRRDVRENVERMLMPLVHELESKAPAAWRDDLRLLREGLDQITSPFLRGLVRATPSLTPTEVRVCEMIRGGMTSKDIARIRGVSPATIHRQRESIRRKLGITGRRVNLASYLQAAETGRGS